MEISPGLSMVGGENLRREVMDQTVPLLQREPDRLGTSRSPHLGAKSMIRRDGWTKVTVQHGAQSGTRMGWAVAHKLV